MLGPGVEPRSCTRAATPISGGCRGMARTRNSVCEKSPVRYHVAPATVASVTRMMAVAGTIARIGYLRSVSANRRHGSWATIMRATRSLPSAVNCPSAVRTGTVAIRADVPPLARHGRRRQLVADVARRVDQRRAGTVARRLDAAAARLGDDHDAVALCGPHGVGDRRRVATRGVGERQARPRRDRTARRRGSRRLPRCTTTWLPRPIADCVRPRGFDWPPAAGWT